MIRLPCFRVIAPHCIVHSCGANNEKSTLPKVRVAFINAYRKKMVSLRGVVQVQCMQNCKSQYLQLRDNVEKEYIWFHAKTRK